jgi:uncharacterized protein (TIGR00369 family)
MADQNPHTNFGLVERDVVLRDGGHAFLLKLLDGTYPAPPFSQTCEIWPAELEPGRIVFEARPSERFYNPMGTVHGGWISTVLDTAMACAVQSMLKPGQGYTTAEMKVNFVRPVFERTGKLRCEGKIVHNGGRLATSEGRLTDSAGNLIAHGSETCLILSA